MQFGSHGLVDFDGGNTGHAALVEGRQIICAGLRCIRTQWLRYQRQDFDCNGIKPRHRNHVAGEWIPDGDAVDCRGGGGVEDRAALDGTAQRVDIGPGSRCHQGVFLSDQAGKIALAKCCDRYRVRQGVIGQLLAELLETEEEERFVLAVVNLRKPDRAADGKAVVLLSGLVLDSGAGLSGVQGFIDQVVIAGAVQTVGAAW